MKEEKLETQLEVFICNHEKAEGSHCSAKGSKDLTDHLKMWAKENYKNQIKVVRSGCLGKCSKGIAVLSYPEKKFLLEVTSDDEEKIKKGLIEALK